MGTSFNRPWGKAMGSRKTFNKSEAVNWNFLEFFLDGWTLIDPSNNLRGGYEGSVIFTYSKSQGDRGILGLFFGHFKKLKTKKLAHEKN